MEAEKTNLETVNVAELREKGVKFAPENSSQIALAIYDAAQRVLLVDFKSGGTYLYSDVPQLAFDNLVSAESAGKYFIGAIKPHFAFFKVPKEEVRAEGVSE